MLTFLRNALIGSLAATAIVVGWMLLSLAIYAAPIPMTALGVTIVTGLLCMADSDDE